MAPFFFPGEPSGADGTLLGLVSILPFAVVDPPPGPGPRAVNGIVSVEFRTDFLRKRPKPVTIRTLLRREDKRSSTEPTLIGEIEEIGGVLLVSM